MNKKEIIVTNTIRYKIYRFFRRIFSKSPNKDNRNNTIQIKPDNKFIQNISYKNEIISLNKQKEHLL